MNRRKTLSAAASLAAALALISTVLAGCSSAPSSSSQTPATPAPPPSSATTPSTEGTPATVTELKIQDIKVGTGPAAKAGDNVTVNYTGWLTDGTKFDSSLDHGAPFPFQLGGGQVIPGWDQGVVGMKVGGVRKLIIPPALGYGAQGQGPIPPNATLVFQIQMLKIQ